MPPSTTDVFIVTLALHSKLICLIGVDQHVLQHASIYRRIIQLYVSAPPQDPLFCRRIRVHAHDQFIALSTEKLSPISPSAQSLTFLFLYCPHMRSWQQNALLFFLSFLRSMSYQTFFSSPLLSTRSHVLSQPFLSI